MTKEAIDVLAWLSTRSVGKGFFFNISENVVETQEILERGQRDMPAEKRGEITRFSRESRVRMLTAIQKISRSQLERSLFVTLTYPQEFPSDIKKSKLHLREFLRRVSDVLDCPPIIWKMEFQKRGAVHFHLVIMSEKFLDKEWIAENWNAIIDGGVDNLKVGTHVKRCESANDAVFYVVGYLSKQDTPPTDATGIGRWWGIVNRKNVISRTHSVRLDWKQRSDFERFARKLHIQRGWSVQRGGRSRKTLFIDYETTIRWLEATVFMTNGWGIEAGLMKMEKNAILAIARANRWK